VGDYAILGGFTGVHQFVRVGAHSFTGGSTLLIQDLPPYVMAAGNPAQPRGINSEGLKRRGFSPESIAAIRRAYKEVYRSGQTLEEAARKVAASATEVAELKILADFLASPGRGIVR
jgi:UDP-N-acetylglucosamine acyltransferase